MAAEVSSRKQQSNLEIFGDRAVLQSGLIFVRIGLKRVGTAVAATGVFFLWKTFSTDSLLRCGAEMNHGRLNELLISISLLTARAFEIRRDTQGPPLPGETLRSHPTPRHSMGRQDGGLPIA